MLGTRIAILRQKAGLSQAALAARLHISPSALGMYEQGRREPSLEILVALADELGVSTDVLLDHAPTERAPRRVEESFPVRLSPTAAVDYCREHFNLASRDELAVLCLALLMQP
ncbi:MAG: helix-turn-helix domain-containing protein [Faecousia sp.]